MGFLRLLLAAAVVAEHSTPIFGFTFTGGHLAVRLFFIISGFYMALILSTKYTTEQPNRYWLFITNRFSRIYPSYFVVLFLSLAFYAAASWHLHRPADRLVLWQTAWQHGEGLKLFFIGLSNFTIIGMDAVCFFVYDVLNGIHWPGATTAASAAWLPTVVGDASGSVPAWRFLFVPQSWSISIELLFYLLVPSLISWKTRSLLLLGGISVACYMLAGYFLHANLFSVLSYFFFPFHLGLFILGMLAFRYSRPYLAAINRPTQTFLVAGMFFVLAGFQFFTFPFKNFLTFTFVILALPILFHWTKESRINKWVGDLSYPIYICHIFVKWVLLALAGVSQVGVTSPPGWLLLVVSAAMAATLLWFLDYPIDRWRQQRVRKISAIRQTGSPEVA